MSNKRYHLRVGYTLIEALVMISIFTTVMIATLSWIHLSMKFSRNVKNRAIVHQQLNRLSNELRANISISDSVKVEGETLILDIDSTVTRYTIKDRAIERSGEAVLADDSKIVTRETFRIGRDVDARWDSEEVPDGVSLTIRQKPVTTSSGDSSASVGSLETPKLEFYLRAAPRKGGQ